jgi:hypothetical protein
MQLHLCAESDETEMIKDYTVIVRAPFDEDYPDDRYLVHVRANSPKDAAYEARMEAEFKDRGHREGQEKGANLDYDILYLFEGKLKDLKRRAGE